MTSSMITRMPRACASSTKRLEVVERAVARVDVRVVRDVVAVVRSGDGIERQQPEAGDAEVLQVVELRPVRPRKSPMPSPLLSKNDLHVGLVDDRVLVPEWIVVHRYGSSSSATGCASGRRRPAGSGVTSGPSMFRTRIGVGTGRGTSVWASAHAGAARRGSHASSDASPVDRLPGCRAGRPA